jgi:elongation factor G
MGDVLGDISARRGKIVGMENRKSIVAVEAQVPLAEMFGYATVLRSATQGKAGFTMEFKRYAPAPADAAEALRKQYLDKRQAGGK